MPFEVKPPSVTKPEKVILAMAFLAVLAVLNCGGPPSVVIRRYETPPTSNQELSSPWDDPTLVIIENRGWNKVTILTVSGEKGEVIASLGPYQSSGNLYFALGEHLLRVVIEKTTGTGKKLETVRFITVSIEPEGHSQVIAIN